MGRAERHTGVGLRDGVVEDKLGRFGRNGRRKENRKLQDENFAIDAAPAFHPNPPDGTGLDITLCHTCQLFPSSLESRGFDIERPRVRVYERSFEVGSWLGQVEPEPKVPVVGGQSWHGWKKAANGKCKCHVEANRVHCPLSTSAIHCPPETRRRLETCRNFALGTSPFTFFRPVSVLWSRHRRRPRICSCREWLSNEYRELYLAPICPCRD